MTKTDDALKNFNSGYDCCTAVVSAFKNDLDLDEKHKQACSGTCISMPGKPRELCGAVQGALGVIRNLKSEEQKQKLMEEFKSKFTKKHDSLKCKDLLGCDLNDPYVVMDVMEKNLCDNVCQQFVSDAVEILESMIIE